MKVVRSFYEDGKISDELVFDDDRNFVSGRYFFDNFNFSIYYNENVNCDARNWVKEYKETGKCSFKTATFIIDTIAANNP